MLGREASDPIDHLRVCLAILLDSTSQLKDLCDPRPLPTQKVIQFRAGRKLFTSVAIMFIVENPADDFANMDRFVEVSFDVTVAEP